MVLMNIYFDTSPYFHDVFITSFPQIVNECSTIMVTVLEVLVYAFCMSLLLTN